MGNVLKEIGGKMCVTTAHLAQIFGVSAQAVGKWEKKGCPKAARGYWHVPDVIRWKNGEQDENMSPAAKKMFWEAECKKAQTEHQQFKNAVLRGEYLEKAEVQKELSDFFISLRKAAFALPRKAAILASAYIGDEKAREMEDEIQGMVTNALEHWAAGRFAGMDTGGTESDEAPREDDG